MTDQEAGASVASKLDRNGRALALTIGTLAAYNVVRSLWIPTDTQLLTNLLLAGAMALIAHWAGLTHDDIGLHKTQHGKGARWGATTLGLILLVVATGAIAAQYVPALTGFVNDARVQVPLSDMIYEVAVNTPFGTVLAEELAFRGVLFALLMRRFGTVAATAWCSLLFGCWHIMPTLSTAADNGGLSAATASPLALAGFVAGNVLVTGFAGAAFCWLRIRSDSLLAPMLAHLGINSGSFLVGWISNH